jgi:putative ATP-dependent endonuclease of OLD family
MFRAFLRIRPHLPAGDEDSLEVLPTTILVTTHSPHLVSIAPLTTLVLLRRETAPGSDSKPVRHTIGSSMASNQLDPTEVADLERYLEVTRAEMLFARGVLLVEGEADLYLVPKIASLHGVDLDKLGVTTCSVGGTHFQSHCVFLRQMGIPFAVVTDGDPTRKVTGEARVKALLKKLLGDKVFGALPPEKHLAKAASEGLFLGQETIELDLLAAGRKKAISRALIDLAPSPTARKRAEEWLADPTTIDSVQVLKDIEEIGKGRFAQRLASSLRAKKNGLNGPQYIVDAIDFIVNRLAS